MQTPKFLIRLVAHDSHPTRGLLAVEWAMMLYLLFTLALMACLWPRIQQPAPMLIGRLAMVIGVLLAWIIYQWKPCRITHLARILLQLGLLSWWYPDTYEINKLLPNYDPYFAAADQWLFGCQPALLFSQWMPQHWWSELMHLGYASYYPLMVAVSLYYFCCRYERFARATFVLLASFFVYYVIFDVVPVTGPQYYYLAAGTDQIGAGVFPEIGQWFINHTESLPIPGWSDGFCYHLVAAAHAAGERPTAAFPSSHVGVTTILMLLAWKSGSRKLLWSVTPFYILMCMATVYIQAHYAIDVIGGWVSGVIFYFALDGFYRKNLESRK